MMGIGLRLEKQAVAHQNGTPLIERAFLIFWAKLSLILKANLLIKAQAAIQEVARDWMR
jgi:hypothetical protein